MKHTKLFVSIIALCLNVVAFGQGDYKSVSDPTTLLNKLKSVSNNTSTISADFVEEKHLAVLNLPQTSQGHFYYQKDDKMRWQQNSPSKFIFLMNGESLRIQDEGKEKDLGEGIKIASRINKFMMGLIQGDYQDDKKFMTECFESDSDYMIVLTPQNKTLKKMYSTLKLHFSKKDYRLQKISFFETNGDNKIVTFTNQEYNKTLKNELFTKF